METTLKQGYHGAWIFVAFFIGGACGFIGAIVLQMILIAATSYAG